MTQTDFSWFSASLPTVSYSLTYLLTSRAGRNYNTNTLQQINPESTNPDIFHRNKLVHSWNKSFSWSKIRICRFKICFSVIWTSYLLERHWFLLDKFSSVAWFNPIHILNHFNTIRIGMILQDWGAFLTTTVNQHLPFLESSKIVSKRTWKLI